MAKIRDAGKSRQNILAAAETEFAEKGFYGARVDEVAVQAGINKRMIYAYFGDKEGLYKQVLFRVYARMEDVERELVEQQYSGTELIEKIISAYFQFLKSNPTFVSILMWENLNKGRYLQEIESSRIERATIRYFVGALEEGKASGLFRPEIDSWQTVISLITTCFANFSNQYTLSKLFHTDLGSEAVLEQRRKHTTDLILAYLCKDSKEDS